MSIFENRGSYLFVRLTEPYSLKLIFSFLREFAEVCDQQHLDKALIDGFTVDGPISIWDQSISSRNGVCAQMAGSEGVTLSVCLFLVEVPKSAYKYVALDVYQV